MWISALECRCSRCFQCRQRRAVQQSTEIDFPRFMADTNTQRASKRQQTSHSTAHHDPIPIDEDDVYRQVFHREGRLRRVGNDVVTATTSRDLVQSTDHRWTSMASWAPPDDLNYALETDGLGYENAVEADVMEEPVIPKKYTKSRVSVSSSTQSFSPQFPSHYS